MSPSARGGGPFHAQAAGAILASLRPGAFPGCAWAIADGGGTIASHVLGDACQEPSRSPVLPETLYDLASVTKPLSTALLALKAWEDGDLDLDEPVRGAKGKSFTPMDLLRHEAGFPAWRPLYALGLRVPEVKAWLLRKCPRSSPREKAKYSCLDFILLGFLLEEALGGPIGDLFRTRIATPLGLAGSDLLFNPPAGWRGRVAPTELLGESEAAKAAALGERAPEIPEGGLWGVVGDGNARFLGGAAGNAGLFGTALETCRLARAFHPDGGFLGPKALNAAWAPGVSSQGEMRTAGWKMAGTAGWGPGEALSPGSIGHEGYTGTGAYLDRSTGAVVVLLTNRIHPRHPGTDFGPIRAAFLRAVLGRGGAGQGSPGGPMVRVAADPSVAPGDAR
jgi:serine-type D-Ala-D-Ala carboxypeptidase